MWLVGSCVALTHDGKVVHSGKSPHRDYANPKLALVRNGAQNFGRESAPSNTASHRWTPPLTTSLPDTRRFLPTRMVLRPLSYLPVSFLGSLDLANFEQQPSQHGPHRRIPRTREGGSRP